MFYEKLLELCKLRGVTPTEVTRQIGVNKSNVTYWKNGSIPKATTMNKIANYFGCTVEYLLGDVPEPAIKAPATLQDQEKKPAADSNELNERDKKDIAKSLEVIMSDLENSRNLMFYGDPASPEAIESIRNAMAMVLEYAKKVNKQKCPPGD